MHRHSKGPRFITTKEMLPKVDIASACVINSFIANFDELITHLRHQSSHRDTNYIENAIRLVRQPIQKGLRQMRDKELAKAVLGLAMMRYEARVLGIRDWVRWSQRPPSEVAWVESPHGGSSGPEPK